MRRVAVHPAVSAATPAIVGPTIRAVAATVVLALVAVLLCATPAGADPRSDTGPVTYVHPVDAPVLDPFRAPASTYGPGNRGLEYDTAPGDPVHAAAPGRVAFAGEVAGSRHVTVAHRDGRLTSYSFLADVEVRIGQEVDGGDVVGTAGGPVHVSVREGGEYVDPALLFGVEVTSVRLVPENPRGGDLWQQAAREMLALAALARAESGGGWGIVGDIAGSLRDAGGAVLDAGGAVVDTIEAALPLMLEIALALAPIALAPILGPVLTALVFSLVVPALLGEELPLLELMREGGPLAMAGRVLHRGVEWWRQRDDCTPDDVEPPPPARRRVAVLVAGLDSTSDDGAIGELPVRDLGYADDDVLGFSYDGGRTPDPFGATDGEVAGALQGLPVRPYDRSDSSTDLAARGDHLADLLTEVAERQPGTPIDLYAHSQGGVVTRLALAELATRPGGPEVLASLGLVATIGTPHQGADLATVAMVAAGTGEGSFALAVADDLLDRSLDPDEATNIEDLSLGSDLLDELGSTGLPEGPEYLSIAGRGDPVVLAERTRLDGATNVVVGVDGLSAHSQLPGDPEVARELALARAGMPPTCVGFAEFVLDVGVSEAMHIGTTFMAQAVAEWSFASILPELAGDGLADFVLDG